MNSPPLTHQVAWRRVALIGLAGLLVAWVAGVGFAWALQARGDWGVGLPWERELLLRIDRTEPAVFDWVMLLLPWLGTNLTIAPMIAVAAVWLVWKRRRLDLALHLCMVVAGSLMLNAFLKAVFDRPRPDLWEPRGQYQWAAYPSGHAIVGVAVIFTIAILLYREKAWRWPYLVAAGLLVVNLYSRLYLGVHWPTDVIGGLLIGVIWLAATLYAFRPVGVRGGAAEGASHPNRVDSSRSIPEPGA